MFVGPHALNKTRIDVVDQRLVDTSTHGHPLPDSAMDQDSQPPVLILGYRGAIFTALHLLIDHPYPEIEITDEFFHRFFSAEHVPHEDEMWNWLDNGKWSMSLGSKTGIFRVRRDDVERVYQVMETVPERNTKKARWPD